MERAYTNEKKPYDSFNSKKSTKEHLSFKNNCYDLKIIEINAKRINDYLKELNLPLSELKQIINQNGSYIYYFKVFLNDKIQWE